MRRIVLASAAGGLALVATATFAAFYFERPSSVRVAVARDSAEHRLLIAAQQVMARDREGIRFRLVPVAGASASSAAVESGSTDFAVIRSDIDLPRNGLTALIFNHSVAVIMAPAGSPIHTIADLGGRKIGIVQHHTGTSADIRLLDTILGRYEAGEQATHVPLDGGEVQDALRDGRIDALMVVGPLQSDRVRQAVSAVTAAGGGPPVFVPVTEAKAVTQSSPVYESIEITRGAFGGASPRPDHDVEAIGVSTRLVARSTASDGTVGAVTRLLFSKRLEIAASAPDANQMEAPSTNRDSVLPAHPGATAYLEGEEETFLEKYSDIIYIGAMVVSVLASAAAALASRMSASSHARIEDMLARLMVLLAAARRAASTQELDEIETETDSILIEALQVASLPALDTHRATAFALALDQVRYAIRDRRRHLTGYWSRSSYEPPRILAGE